MIEIKQNNTYVEVHHTGNVVEHKIVNTDIEVSDASTTVEVASGNPTILMEDHTTVIEVAQSEAEIVTVGTQGPAGPAGPAGGEDTVPYSKQVDFIDDDHFYIGEADPGSASSSAVWRIKYVVIAGDGDVSTTWADGDALFDNVWDDRATLSYS